MDKKPAILVSLVVVVALSLLCAALIPLILPTGAYWQVAGATFIITLLTLMVLWGAWLLAGCKRAIAWMMLAAFILRLALGVYLTWGLPQYGYDELAQNLGYVYTDSFRRDTDAWHLVHQDQPFQKAFSGNFVGDQYGGLLALSMLVYQSAGLPNHAPVLMIIITAGFAALAIPFLYAVLDKTFNKKLAAWAGWLMVLLPEALLLGSAQMREPYLITFFAMLFWAVMFVFDARHRLAAILLGLFSMAGMALFSSKVALAVIGVILVLGWLEFTRRSDKKWLQVFGWASMAAAVVLLILFMGYWLVATSSWDISLMMEASGQLQMLTATLPAWLKTPFVVVYGLFQPVLPAAITDPAPWIWQSLGILRGLGWYALLPVLGYSLISIWRVQGKEKRLLIWMALALLIWLVVSSLRAGGDQWDNPRYRMIFLPWMSTLAAFAMQQVQHRRDRWFGRVLGIWGLVVVAITYWYLSRYVTAFPMPPFWIMFGVLVVAALGIIVGGILLDRRRAKISQQHQQAD